MDVREYINLCRIKKGNISEAELAHLDYFVNNVIAGKNKIVFYVFGATDSVTGSDRRNAELRKERALYIVDVLKNDYGLTNIIESEKPLVDIDESETLSRAAVISVTE